MRRENAKLIILLLCHAFFAVVFIDLAIRRLHGERPWFMEAVAAACWVMVFILTAVRLVRQRNSLRGTDGSGLQ